jgi:hypothetical protein
VRWASDSQLSLTLSILGLLRAKIGVSQGRYVLVILVFGFLCCLCPTLPGLLQFSQVVKQCTGTNRFQQCIGFETIALGKAGEEQALAPPFLFQTPFSLFGNTDGMVRPTLLI